MGRKEKKSRKGERREGWKEGKKERINDGRTGRRKKEGMEGKKEEKKE